MSSLRQETLVYGLVGFTRGEDSARNYHQDLRDDGDDETGAFHLVSSYGDMNGFVYDPTSTQDPERPGVRFRPPSLTTDIVNVRSPSARFHRVIIPMVRAKNAADADEFDVLLLVGGRVDCFLTTGRQGDPRFARGYFVDGAMAWGHTQTGDEFPRFRGKKPRRFWDEDGEDGRTLHVQRRGAGVLYSRRVMKNRAGAPTHLRSTVVTVDARWLDRDPSRDHLLLFDVATFHQDAPACSGRYYDPVPELFDERFQGPLERALALYREHCRTPGTSSRRRPESGAHVFQLSA